MVILTLLSIFFTCSTYMQNFKNLWVAIYLMTPPKLIMPCPFLNSKFYVNVPDPLCPLSYFCILNLCDVSNLYEVQNFVSFLHSFISCLPLFGYLQSFHFILKMNERIEWKKVIKMIKLCQNLVVTHSICIYTYLLLVLFLPL